MFLSLWTDFAFHMLGGRPGGKQRFIYIYIAFFFPVETWEGIVSPLLFFGAEAETEMMDGWWDSKLTWKKKGLEKGGK